MDPDTAIGGASGRFPATRHSVLFEARNGDEQARGRALESIAAAYWKPVYKYIRLKWRASNEDAKDLTQGFFALAAEKDFLARYDQRKATFRTYLRTCLDAFLANEHKFANRQKRGGNLQILSFDFADAERELAQWEPADPVRFDEVFEKEWIRSLFAASVRLLEQQRPDIYRVFARYDLCEDERPTYAQLGAELGIPATTVTNHLAAARRELRRLVLEQLRAITATDEEFRAEAQALLGAGAV